MKDQKIKKRKAPESPVQEPDLKGWDPSTAEALGIERCPRCLTKLDPDSRACHMCGLLLAESASKHSPFRTFSHYFDKYLSESLLRSGSKLVKESTPASGSHFCLERFTNEVWYRLIKKILRFRFRKRL